MAKIQAPGLDVGATYFAIIQNPAGLYWTGTGNNFAAANTITWATAAVALSPDATVTNYYSADFPAAITSAGVYLVEIYQQAGGSPALSDVVAGLLAENTLPWNGTAEVTAVSGTWLTSSTLGTGNIVVTQNQGGTDYLKPKINKVGQPNVTVSAYLQSDWDAGNRAIGYVKDQIVTNSSGDWPGVMKLAAGTYAFAFNDNRDFYPAITGVAVA